MQPIFDRPTSAEISLWQSVKVKVFTSGLVVCTGINFACSAFDLTIPQWNQLAVSGPESYVTKYNGYSSLQYPPEYGFFWIETNATVPIPSNSNAAYGMNTFGFYNMFIW